MNPEQVNRIKLFNTSSPEELLYSYTPTFGLAGIQAAPASPVIINAIQSGISVGCTLDITTWRLVFKLNAAGCSQCLEMGLEELTGIYPASPWSDSTLLIRDKTDWFKLSVTRPHFVATDIWASIAISFLREYERRRDLAAGLSLLGKIDVSTIKVPSDFLSSKGQSWANRHLSLGFCFPIDSPPSVDIQSLKRLYPGSFRVSAPSEMAQTIVHQIGQVSDKQKNEIEIVHIYLPSFSMRGGPYILDQWLVDDACEVSLSQPVVRVRCSQTEDVVALKATANGILRHAKSQDALLEVGRSLGWVITGNTESESTHTQSPASASTDHLNLQAPAKSKTTASAVRDGVLSPAAGRIPKFQPSIAKRPKGFESTGSLDKDFAIALTENHRSFQSFYNDKNVISAESINDDVISLPCFDEALYCALVREMHRYSLAEISDKKDELAKQNAGLGAMVGSFLGLMTGNLFAPFLGHSYAKNLTDRGKKVADFLPDPNLLFYQDQNSYLSWTKGQVSSPRLRRLIIDRQLDSDGCAFFRLIPAIVTNDSVFPIQLFKLSDESYFYRPFCAGIDRDQENYDAVRLQKRYFHLRGEGTTTDSGIQLFVRGQDIETHNIKIYRFTGASLDYLYADFKIQPGSVF